MNNNADQQKKELKLPQVDVQKCTIRKTVIDENGLTHEIEETIELPAFEDDDI